MLKHMQMSAGAYRGSIQPRARVTVCWSHLMGAGNQTWVPWTNSASS